MFKILLRTLKFIESYKKRVIAAFVFSFFRAILINSPLILAYLVIMNFYKGTPDPHIVLYTSLGVVGSILLQALLAHTSDRLQSGAGFEVFADKRIELAEHLRKLPMGFFTEGNIGRISSILSTDMVFIEENAMSILAEMMSFIFSEIVIIICMFFMHPIIGTVTLIFALLMMLTGKGMCRVEDEQSRIRQQQGQNLTDAVIEYTEGFGIIKSFNMMGKRSRELTRNFDKSCQDALRFETLYTPWNLLLNSLIAIGCGCILAVTLYLNVHGSITNINTIGILLFLMNIFTPIKSIYGYSASFTVMNASLDRIEKIFAEPELHDTGKGHFRNSYEGPEIEFRNVTFGYDQKTVLKGISFASGKKTMTALVGPSGGGKSTVVNLLARFWDIEQGEILVRGKNIKDVSLAELMSQISMVFQRVYLFHDTIYNNIAIGCENVTREKVIEAAKKARCYDFIMALPNGFDTVIDEGGSSLSGGEKQRISIARCILKDAPIVILDEATASIDADNERYIQEAISELCKGKTLLVIAHRLQTIRYADQIMVISNGQVKERGTHEELMERGQIYKTFVMKKSSNIIWKSA